MWTLKLHNLDDNWQQYKGRGGGCIGKDHRTRAGQVRTQGDDLKQPQLSSEKWDDVGAIDCVEVG